jgi:L-ascorbate metabolism protein UlaG (beta-lactamase superfamily)
MFKTSLLCGLFLLAIVASLTAQNESKSSNPKNVSLKYLGAAGWEISDGTTVILIDPYLSRIAGPPPPGGGSGHPIPGDTRRTYGWHDVAEPDAAVID